MLARTCTRIRIFRLIHVTDWLPTLLFAAGFDKKVNGIDGINQWNALLHNQETGPRKEMLYNIDPGRTGTKFINAGIRYKDMKLLVGDPGAGQPSGWVPPPKVTNFLCQQISDMEDHFFPKGKKYARLFNLTSDPYEKKNLAKKNPDIVKDLKERLAKYFASMIKPNVGRGIEAGHPKNFGRNFTHGWCQAEPI